MSTKHLKSLALLAVTILFVINIQYVGYAKNSGHQLIFPSEINVISPLRSNNKHARLAIDAGTISPSAITINKNTAPREFTGTAASGGNGMYAYQWQSSTDNGTSWSTIDGATSLNYAPGILIKSTSYRRLVVSNGMSMVSNVVVVTIR